MNNYIMRPDELAAHRTNECWRAENCQFYRTDTCMFRHELWPKRPHSAYDPNLEVHNPLTCTMGVSCRHPHSQDEMRFHPAKYKRNRCIDDRCAHAKQPKFCWKSHTERELREGDRYYRLFRGPPSPPSPLEAQQWAQQQALQQQQQQQQQHQQQHEQQQLEQIAQQQIVQQQIAQHHHQQQQHQGVSHAHVVRGLSHAPPQQPNGIGAIGGQLNAAEFSLGLDASAYPLLGSEEGSSNGHNGLFANGDHHRNFDVALEDEGESDVVAPQLMRVESLHSVDSDPYAFPSSSRFESTFAGNGSGSVASLWQTPDDALWGGSGSPPSNFLHAHSWSTSDLEGPNKDGVFDDTEIVSRLLGEQLVVTDEKNRFAVGAPLTKSSPVNVEDLVETDDEQRDEELRAVSLADFPHSGSSSPARTTCPKSPAIWIQWLRTGPLASAALQSCPVSTLEGQKLVEMLDRPKYLMVESKEQQANGIVSDKKLPERVLKQGMSWTIGRASVDEIERSFQDDKLELAADQDSGDAAVIGLPPTLQRLSRKAAVLRSVKVDSSLKNGRKKSVDQVALELSASSSDLIVRFINRSLCEEASNHSKGEGESVAVLLPAGKSLILSGPLYHVTFADGIVLRVANATRCAEEARLTAAKNMLNAVHELKVSTLPNIA